MWKDHWTHKTWWHLKLSRLLITLSTLKNTFVSDSQRGVSVKCLFHCWKVGFLSLRALLSASALSSLQLYWLWSSKYKNDEPRSSSYWFCSSSSSFSPPASLVQSNVLFPHPNSYVTLPSPPPLHQHCPGNIQTELGHSEPEASVSRYFTSRVRT